MADEASGGKAAYRVFFNPPRLSTLQQLPRWKLMQSYAPSVVGVASYGMLGSHIVHRGLLRSLFGSADLAAGNVLLFNSHVGLGVALYFSQPFSRAPPLNRLVYSAYASAACNFFSILFWAWLRQMCQDVPTPLKILLALGSGSAILFVGADFFAFINNLLKRK